MKNTGHVHIINKRKLMKKLFRIPARHETLSTHVLKKQPTCIPRKYTGFLPIFEELLPENKAEFILLPLFWIVILFKFSRLAVSSFTDL